MTKNEWMAYHGFDNDDMNNICEMLELSSGKITAVKDHVWIIEKREWLMKGLIKGIGYIESKKKNNKRNT